MSSTLSPSPDAYAFSEELEAQPGCESGPLRAVQLSRYKWPELTNPPGHLWRDKWTALSGPLSGWPHAPDRSERARGAGSENLGVSSVSVKYIVLTQNRSLRAV